MADTKILVVDDDHTIADSVEALLRAKGYTVLRAVDGVRRSRSRRRNSRPS